MLKKKTDPAGTKQVLLHPFLPDRHLCICRLHADEVVLFLRYLLRDLRYKASCNTAALKVPKK